MSSTLFLILHWRDPKLEKLVSNKSVVNIFGNNIDRVWKPDIYFVNGKNVERDTIAGDGRALKIQRGCGVFYIMRYVRGGGRQ